MTGLVRSASDGIARVNERHVISTSQKITIG